MCPWSKLIPAILNWLMLLLGSGRWPGGPGAAAACLTPQAANLTRHGGDPGVGARNGRERQRQALQVAARTVLGFALLLDGACQLGHGAVEAIGEPGALQRGAADAGRRIHDDGLLR